MGYGVVAVGAFLCGCGSVEFDVLVFCEFWDVDLGDGDAVCGVAVWAGGFEVGFYGGGFGFDCSACQDVFGNIDRNAVLTHADFDSPLQ